MATRSNTKECCNFYHNKSLPYFSVLIKMSSKLFFSDIISQVANVEGGDRPVLWRRQCRHGSSSAHKLLCHRVIDSVVSADKIKFFFVHMREKGNILNLGNSEKISCCVYLLYISRFYWFIYITSSLSTHYMSHTENGLLLVECLTSLPHQPNAVWGFCMSFKETLL